MKLHDISGNRLYLSAKERAAFLETAKEEAPRPVRSFCAVLHGTGCRISEALALSPKQVDIADGVIIFETLKKRRGGIYRAVPASPDLLELLDMVHGIREAHGRGKAELLDAPLWTWERTTAWRRVKEVMVAAGITDGAHRTPKGLRHGYGIHAIGSGIPLNLLSKWMGHSSLEVTAIYADATGEEAQNIASRMWE